ncbi:MAG: (2Fe-2S)-binding protein [Cyanobacteria bacterium REEB65]|nr:(2Fe-2S)-binding protein [Cyanobacteria bacterium REEB65]
MALVTIDGQTFDVPDGENVIQAAARIGIHIPHYCFHPGLPIDGNCRMCLVEVEGARGLQVACNTILRSKRDKEGNEVPAAVVRQDTELVREARAGVMEFELLNHPIDCVVCDQAGECGLQDYYMSVGKYDHRSKVPKVEKRKAVPIGPQVMLDQERCILCSRCVRFTNTVTKTGELVIAGRGDKCRIETFPGMELDNDYSANVVDVCPVGALTSRDFRFKKRVWFLKSTPSICTGCSRGCNVIVDQDMAVVYRYRPRYNPHVNDWWLCDRGRLSYKAIHMDRLLEPLESGEPSPWKPAFEAAAAQVRDKRVGFVVGPHASLEDMWVAKAMAEALGAPLWGLSWSAPGKEDDFLMKGDLTPNRKGFELLGLNADEASLRNSVAGLETLVAIDVALPDDLAPKALVALTTHHQPTARRATVALPIAIHAERFATWANFEGRIQKGVPAFEPPGDALPAREVLGLLAARLGKPVAYELEEIWAQLAPVLGLSGQTFYDIPLEGLPVGAGEASCKVTEPDTFGTGAGTTGGLPR